MNHEEKPLDLEAHEDETGLSVWKRRFMFVLLIGLCVAFAAPTFGSCHGAFGRGGEVVGSYTVAGEKHLVTDIDLRRVHYGLAAWQRLEAGENSRRPEPTDEDVWTHLVLGTVAKSAGVHVPDEQITEELIKVGFAKPDGSFDEQSYRRALKDRIQLTHEQFGEAMREELRIRGYLNVYRTALTLTPSSDAYESWKKTAAKVTVDYVAQPYETFTAQADATPVSDDDLAKIASQADVRALRAIPARRGFEAAVLRVVDVDEARKKAMEEFLVAAGVYPSTKEIAAEAFNWFFSNQKTGEAFTHANWTRWKSAAYLEAKKAWDEQKAAWDAKPDPKDPLPAEPADPAKEPEPANPREAFEKRWREFVTKEVLARATLKHMAGRAERESKPLAELAPEYARFGVRVVATPEPLADRDMVERFPEGLGRDTELGTILRSKFPVPAAGATFVPKVHPETLQTTRLNDHVADRGFFILRSTSVEPPKEKEIAEVRPEMEKIVRAHRREEMARDVLAALRTNAEAEPGDRAAALRKHAALTGLEVGTVRRFNHQSWRPSPPTEPSTPEQVAQAAKIRHRVRVQQDWDALSRTEAGKFRDPILLDANLGAAYLELVTEKADPQPVEMGDTALERERNMRRMEVFRKAMDLLSFDGLKKKYDIQFEPQYQTTWDEKVKEKKKRSGQDDGGE